MRKLMYFTLGFGAACALCAYVLPEGWRGVLLLCTVFLTAGCAFAGQRWKPVRRVAFSFLGCAVGLFWFSQYYSIYLDTAVALDGQTRNVTIRVSDYSYETAYGIGVEGNITLDGKSYQVRAYLDEKEPLEPGREISGLFRFRVTTPDGAGEATYHQGKGIFLLAYQEDEVQNFTSSDESWRDYPAKLRRQITEILQNCFPSDTAPFAKALLLGDTTDLGYETETDFSVSGIRHVVAVSGLHVSILFALLSTITFRKRFLTALVGFPILFLFAALAGFTPSVTRACIMSALMLLALLFDKEYDSATALSFAALVMLIVNPLVITSVSFQLSVGSVAGLYLFNPGIQRWLKSLFSNTKGRKNKLVNWFVSSVSVTLSAMTITTPLSALYFGTVSLISVVTNLLALWVISFVFYGLIAVCLTSLVWKFGAVLLAKVISLPIRYVLFIARMLADIPLAAVYTQSIYVTAWLVFVYVLLLIFLVSKNRKPVTLGCCAVLGLCFALLASWAEPLMDDTRITVLDVGQGQCILLQSEGRTYMVDCGGDDDETTADIAAETLLSQGISRLDGLILTHCDRDHAGAAANLLTRVDTDLLILPAVSEAAELAAATTGEVVYAEDDLLLAFGSTQMGVYAPTYPGSGNESSLCVLFDTEKCDILITGDRNAFGERMLLRNADIPDADILVAGHHGSKNSTCEELLQAVQPEMVCISVGEDNSYGHPAPELLQRLAEFGCAVWRTDQSGTIIIRR